MGTHHAIDTRLKDLVFVLEDEEDVARTMCDALRRFDYDTEHFTRGHEVLRRVERKRPALCIVDLGLPDLDGLDVVRKLQEGGGGRTGGTSPGDATAPA